MKIDHPNGNKKKLKKFYTQQNQLIDQFLGAEDEERLHVSDFSSPIFPFLDCLTGKDMFYPRVLLQNQFFACETRLY